MRLSYFRELDLRLHWHLRARRYAHTARVAVARRICDDRSTMIVLAQCQSNSLTIDDQQRSDIDIDRLSIVPVLYFWHVLPLTPATFEEHVTAGQSGDATFAKHTFRIFAVTESIIVHMRWKHNNENGLRYFGGGVACAWRRERHTFRLIDATQARAKQKNMTGNNCFETFTDADVYQTAIVAFI
jgi:hypothetical protein